MRQLKFDFDTLYKDRDRQKRMDIIKVRCGLLPSTSWNPGDLFFAEPRRASGRTINAIIRAIDLILHERVARVYFVAQNIAGSDLAERNFIRFAWPTVNPIRFRTVLYRNRNYSLRGICDQSPIIFDHFPIEYSCPDRLLGFHCPPPPPFWSYLLLRPMPESGEPHITYE